MREPVPKQIPQNKPPPQSARPPPPQSARPPPPQSAKSIQMPQVARPPPPPLANANKPKPKPKTPERFTQDFFEEHFSQQQQPYMSSSRDFSREEFFENQSQPINIHHDIFKSMFEQGNKIFDKNNYLFERKKSTFNELLF